MQDTRQQTYRELFLKHFNRIRKQYGVGQFSFTEGMNRNAARKIARNLARSEMRRG
jgi:DNA polymerase/3'-5' exonuclease PolX